MKIAVASEGTDVSQHFGHCEKFTIFEIEDGKAFSDQVIANPGHECGSMPRFLKDLGVSVVISGGMGAGAFNGLQSNGLIPVTGAEGTTRDAVEGYLSGRLKTGGFSCGCHEGHDHSNGSCRCHGH